MFLQKKSTVLALITILSVLGCPEPDPSRPQQPEKPSSRPDAGQSTAVTQVKPDAGPAIVLSDSGPNSVDNGDASLPSVSTSDAGTEISDAAMPPEETSVDAGVQQDSGIQNTDNSGHDSGNVVVDAGPDPCDAPITITPDIIYTQPYSLSTLVCSGGSGTCQFEMVGNENQGTINANTGAFLSGPQAPFDEVIRVYDNECGSEIFVDVFTLLPLEIYPKDPYLPTAGLLSFEVVNGSDTIVFELVANETGGTLIPGQSTYQAGPNPGRDVLKATDLLTGAVDTINIWVEANHEFIASPKHVVIPLGEKIQVDLNGTGSYSAAISGSGVQVTNELILGDAVGSGLIQYTDNFTALTVTVGFQVVAPQQFNLPRLGDARLDTVMHTIADVTGDGLDDILLGTWDSDITGLDSGAVYLYASNDSGFDVSPFQTWSGKQRDYRFGNAIDTGDINGDGAVDLMIGSFFADEGLNRNGAVYLYLNQDGQLPNEPNRIFVGTNADDYFGHAIGICDFNGDGRDDFAIGARNAEDTNASPRTNNQGAIYIFLGQDGGIPTSYNQVIWGQHWDADNQTWSTRANTYWGTALQTGDINDDGLCDLVAGSYFYPTGSNNKEDGAVFVYLGEAPENFSLGGVSATPAWSIIADDPIYDDDEFGRYLQVADINHDDKDDLLITQWRRGPNQGRLSLFLGRSFEQENTPVIFGVDDHDWFVDGTRSSDYFGSRSQAVDVNGDGLLDIITSGPLAGSNRLGTNNNQRVGLVSVFLGAPNGLPSTETYWESHGDVLNDWWGNSFLYFERNVNDFTRKSIAVLAARTDRNDEYEVFKIGLTEMPPPSSVSVMNDAGFGPQAPCSIERENINRDFGYVGEDVSFNVFAQADEITPVDETQIDAGQMTQIFYAAWAPTHTTSHTLDGLTWIPLDNLSDTASDFAGSLNAPDFGFHRLVGRYANAQGIWVYCDQSPDATFDLASTDTIDMRQALDVPTDHGGGRVGDALAFAPHFLGVNQHALIAGAPSADTEPNRLFSGTAIVYPFTETGVAADPLFRLDKHSNTSSYGYFARDITSAGNFFQAKTDGTTTEDLAIIAQYEDIPNANSRSGWTVNDNCPSGSSLNDAGALYVFPGRAFSEEELAQDPITRDPALILYGLQAGAHLWRVAGGVDINNDAFDDLIISSRFVDNSDAVNNHCPSNNCGGYAVVFGHAPVEDEIHVSCEADETFYGKEGNERLGYDVAALGDVNNDGCDDFVVGARSEDLGVNNQGTVHVIFGWGGTGCPSEPLEVVLGAGFPSSNFGWSLDGGTDVTGDGIPDLVVGAPNTASEGNRVGAAYLISGAYIGSLFPQASSPHSETLPSFLPLGDTVHPVSRILGDNSGENLGHQVKLLPHLGGNGASGIAVGSQYSSSLGFDRSGAVLGFEFDTNAQALEQVPSFAVIGEASRPDSEMGASIETFHDETRSLIAIGASLMSAVSLDQGACFVIDASEF